MVQDNFKIFRQKTLQKFYQFKSKCKCSLKKIFMCNSDCITEVDITPVNSPKLVSTKKNLKKIISF
jgi:hypothetical protein